MVLSRSSPFVLQLMLLDLHYREMEKEGLPLSVNCMKDKTLMSGIQIGIGSSPSSAYIMYNLPRCVPQVVLHFPHPATSCRSHVVIGSSERKAPHTFGSHLWPPFQKCSLSFDFFSSTQVDSLYLKKKYNIYT